MSELIERLAREAGFELHKYDGTHYWGAIDDQPEAFAKAVARECAEIAELSQAGDDRREPRTNTARRCAGSIRDRFGITERAKPNE